MQRRTFLQGVTAGAAGLLAGRGVADVGAEQRFGDLLLRQPATDHYELLFTPARPRPLRLLHLADTLVRNADIDEGLGNLVFQVSEHSASRLGLEPDVIEQVAESAFLELNGSGKIFQQVA